MLQINYVRQTGVSGLTAMMYFEFLFDNATELPAGSYPLEETNYLIAENSIAVDTDGSSWYKFDGKKWIKQLSPIPKLTDSTNITKGGKHLISNNTVRGLRDFDVDADIPSVLGEKNITTNGTYNASSDNVEGYSKVTVNVTPDIRKLRISNNGTYDTYFQMRGYSPVYSWVHNTPYFVNNYNDVNFFDYDGTLLYSYTKEQFANLTAFPPENFHNGLVSQGWNWTLSEAKSYVATMGKLDIGQVYNTDDGCTRIYIKLEEGKLSPVLHIFLCGYLDVIIDWGDSSSTTTVSYNGSSSSIEWKAVGHTYASSGFYVISMKVVNKGTSVSNNGYMGIRGSDNNVSTIINSSYNSNQSSSIDQSYLPCIYKVEIGNMCLIENAAFATCARLKTITIPNWNDSYETYLWHSGFGNCTFMGCGNLRHITFSNTLDNNLLNEVFGNCYKLCTVSLSKLLPERPLGNYIFNNNYMLLHINLPLASTTLDNNLFQSCFSLTELIIPENVTTIGSNVLKNCEFLQYIKFKSSTPPTIQSNSFDLSRVQDICKILVPQGSLTAYTSAPNYPDPNIYTYEEY